MHFPYIRPVRTGVFTVRTCGPYVRLVRIGLYIHRESNLPVGMRCSVASLSTERTATSGVGTSLAVVPDICRLFNRLAM